MGDSLYEAQALAAKFRAERDQARQECERLRARLRDSVPREAYERKRAAWLRQIRECETALHRRRECIKRLENAALERRTVRAEDHEAAEWVREHGGVDAISARLMPEGHEWPRDARGVPIVRGETVWANGDGDGDGRAWYVRRVCPGSAYPVDAEDGKGERRDLKPAWLTHERPAPKALDADGVEIRVGDTVYEVETGERYFVTNVFDGMTEPDFPEHTVECRKYEDVVTHMFRPSQLTHERPVLDADGNRIEPAMDVWWVCEGDDRGVHAEKLHVESIGEDGLVECSPYNGGTWVELEPSELYVNKPVLAADGKPLEVGQTVWDVESGTEYEVVGIHTDEDSPVRVMRTDGSHLAKAAKPDTLTHERPDSWERLEDDATMLPGYYCYLRGVVCNDTLLASSVEGMARDLVRRAKALAERSIDEQV